MRHFFESRRSLNNILLISIILLSIFTRFHGLQVQSLWYDELYIMDIANPSNTIPDIFSDLKAEFHPPFIFLLSHFVFKLFGYNDLVARFISALFGVIGVIAIYFLGRRLKDQRTGILIALLTTINFYHIYHSQEFRMYIPLFFFTTLSLWFFLEIIKTNRIKFHILFAISSILLLYTHYFGFFVLLAELFCFSHVMVKSPDKSLIKRGAITALCIILAYMPWLPFIFIAGSRKHWIGTPPPWYFFEYFYDYVGKDPFSAILLVVGIYLFFKKLFTSKSLNAGSNSTESLLVAYGLLSIYVLSYLISFAKPILIMRCTISALPFLFAAVVMGLDTLKGKYVNWFITITVITSLVNIVFLKDYYSTITKENFRDVASAVSQKAPDQPVYSKYAAFYTYYFVQEKSETKVLDPIGKDPSRELKGIPRFIILNAHNAENIMTLPQYLNWQIYINEHYKIDSIYVAKERTSENAVFYELNSPKK